MSRENACEKRESTMKTLCGVWWWEAVKVLYNLSRGKTLVKEWLRTIETVSATANGGAGT